MSSTTADSSTLPAPSPSSASSSSTSSSTTSSSTAHDGSTTPSTTTTQPQQPTQQVNDKPTPEGYEFFTEGSAKILYQDKNQVFYNPVQEFNRDMSILMIKMYQDILEKEGKPRTIKILEALSATGLRSIRYAKEIKQIDHILSNDIDAAAVSSIRRNAEFNSVDHIIRPNQGDASVVMMQNKSAKYDVVDLDPYGSPSPFLDSAIQCISDGGLLCVTATDMAVLCGSYPDTCFTKYGALPIKSKHCHELALRLLIYCVSVHAARYKKYVVPLLSISVDFYCRIFMRVHVSPSITKSMLCKYSYVFQCSGCGSFHFQPMAKESSSGGHYSANYAPIVNSSLCESCGKKYQMGGPIWTGPTYHKETTQMALAHLKDHASLYNTSKRIFGLFTVISEELEDQPLFMTLPQLCNVLHVNQPSLHVFRSAIVAQGYKVSISHTEGSAVKTNAPISVIWDIMRCYAKTNPPKTIGPQTPAAAILHQEPKITADFTPRDDAEIPSRKVPRFLPNPRENWGPLSRATGQKRSAGEALSLEERRAHNQNKRAKKTVCKFFLKGKCNKDKCIYMHDKPQQGGEGDDDDDDEQGGGEAMEEDKVEMGGDG